MNHNEEVPDLLGGIGDLLPADVLKKVNELLEEGPPRCPHPRPSRPPQRPQGLPLLRLFGVQGLVSYLCQTFKTHDYALLHQRPTKKQCIHFGCTALL